MEFSGTVTLDDRVVFELAQGLGLSPRGNIMSDENEMELRFRSKDDVLTDDERAGLLHEGEESLDLVGCFCHWDLRKRWRGPNPHSIDFPGVV